ncbi:MAG: LamG-like jellyroll fold domain-containing protein [Kofleriaceae bacterium]
MRAAALALALAACTVPNKYPLQEDRGGDGGPPDAPDEGAPDTVISTAPEPFSRSAAATFEFASSDPAATFECCIDGESPAPCASPYTRTLGDASHGFLVRAIAPSGRRDGTPAEHRWTIDTIAPETMLTETPPAADNSVLVRFGFASNEHDVAFECALDGGDYVACTSGGPFGPVDDGAHAFAVRAIDRAGNLDASPAIYAWLVDTSTPDTQLLSGPPAATGSTTATFTFVSDDAGPGATFYCSLDGVPFAACSSPQEYAGLAEGEHGFAVWVRDAVGNADPTPALATWVVDLTPPDTAITSGPSGLVAAASASFSFSASEPGVSYVCSLDSAPFAACSSPFHALGLDQGAHSFAVRAIDAAGHPDPSPATRSWSVDTIAPDLAITAGPAPGETTGPRMVFAFAASEGTISCSLDGAPLAACTSPLAFSLPAGEHQFRISAIDEAGNAATASRAWTVACAGPSAIGAAGLLHLDDAGQLLANAVAGGAPATLGDDETIEVADPSSTPGRFGGGLAFTAAHADHVAWPIGLSRAPALTFELWARPDAVAGTRELVASGDGRIAVRVVAVSATTVRFSIELLVDGELPRTVSSAAVEAGAWHHVIGSLDETALRLWVDGARRELAGSSPGSAPLLDAIRVGGTAMTAYSGALDELWVAQTSVASDEGALARYCPM